MKFCELTIDEYSAFSLKFINNTFLQSSYLKEYYEISSIENYILGVKENDVIIAAALIHTNNKKEYFKVFSCDKGFLLDYSNKELLTFFTTNIKEFLKGKKACALKIDPNVRKSDETINNLTSLGYKKSIKNIQTDNYYTISIENKSEEEIFNSFNSNLKNILRKDTEKYITISEIKYKDLDIFKKITDYTSKTKGFTNRKLEYFQNMYKSFNDHVIFLIVELNVKNAIVNLELELKENNNKYDTIKNINKKEELKIIIDKLNLKILKLKNREEEKVLLSSAMFMLYGDEITYLFSGNYDEFQEFNASYILQWYIIKYAIKHKYKRYNMYGFTEPGVYNFKKKFNGEVINLVGSYDLVLNKLFFMIVK
ncbi:MAG: peptidoglycan bridge formation glycyltransferase FemA/FemB family protein [Bacilli bacterium]